MVLTLGNLSLVSLISPSYLAPCSEDVPFPSPCAKPHLEKLQDLSEWNFLLRAGSFFCNFLSLLNITVLREAYILLRYKP